jgi:hypothetical protein
MGKIKDRLQAKWTSLCAAVAARKGIILTVVFVGVAAGGAYALYCYRNTIENDPKFSVNMHKFRLTSAGPWMTREVMNEVQESLQQLPEKLSVMDSDSSVRVAKALASNPWIKKVEHVRLDRPRGQEPSGIEMSLLFRQPVAFVQVGQGAESRYYMVSADGIRLGNRGYEDPQLGRYVMLTITGATGEPPAPGQVWKDEGVVAAADLAGQLLNSIQRYNLSRVHVTAAASPGSDLELSLFTKHDRTEIVWGGPRCRETAIREGKTFDQKRSRLEALHKKFGGLEKCGRKLDLVEWYREVDPRQPPPVRIAAGTAGRTVH